VDATVTYSERAVPRSLLVAPAPRGGGIGRFPLTLLLSPRVKA
jgi:hypothetical protein